MNPVELRSQGYCTRAKFYTHGKRTPRDPNSIIISVYPDPLFVNPLPLVGIIIGILILRPLEGGWLLSTGLHLSSVLGAISQILKLTFSRLGVGQAIAHFLYPLLGGSGDLVNTDIQ